MKRCTRAAIGLCMIAGLTGACGKEQTPPAPLDTPPDPYSDSGEAAPALPEVELPAREATPVADREQTSRSALLDGSGEALHAG